MSALVPDPADYNPEYDKDTPAFGELWNTKRWRAPFIEGLRTTANVTEAMRSASISRWTVYHDRRYDRLFADAWDDALQTGYDFLEAIALRRATIGYTRTKTKKQLINNVMTIVEETVEDGVSDTLLMFLLNGGRPEKYRQNLRVEHGGKGGDPIKVEIVRERTPERLAELLEIAAELGWSPTLHPVIDSNGYAAELGPAPNENGAHANGDMPD